MGQHLEVSGQEVFFSLSLYFYELKEVWCGWSVRMHDEFLEMR